MSKEESKKESRKESKLELEDFSRGIHRIRSLLGYVQAALDRAAFRGERATSSVLSIEAAQLDGIAAQLREVISLMRGVKDEREKPEEREQKGEENGSD